MIPDLMLIIMFTLSTKHVAASAVFIYGTQCLFIVLVSIVLILWFLYQRRQRAQLQEAYEEQEILVQQQQVLLAEVDRLYREQTQAAVTDAITGLPNHRAVMRKIDEVLVHCRQTCSSCAVLFVDLDHFKRINDTWGHRAGDAILREIGMRLRNTLRLEDFVGRYGGEEFAVALADADMSEASRIAERLRRAVAEPPCCWETEDTQAVIFISITASIGVAVYPLHGETCEILIQGADQAMYRAKQSGRNCVSIAEVESICADAKELKRAPQAPLRVPTGGYVSSSVFTEGGYVSSQEPRSSVWDDKHMNYTVEASIVKALTAAASARDHGTDVHAHRIMRLADATARMLGRPEEELYPIRLAALLHDIGKIGIPDAILHKPGPLTDEEWAIMSRHPEISCEILQQIGGIFYQLAHIVVAHHERWDGHGYPAGLARDAIPLSARIISVVDSYDAMTSRRVYREAVTAEQARAELQRCAGSQYDPCVVEAFLRMLDAQGQNECSDAPCEYQDEATTENNLRVPLVGTRLGLPQRTM